MKKYFLLAILSLASIATFAQTNQWSGGVVLGYGSDISKPSVGLKVQYDLIEQVSFASSFNYYFQDKSEGVKMNWWDANVDAHWNFVHKDNAKIYALAGLTYLHGKASLDAEYDEEDYEVSASEGKLGANIGLGGQLNLSENWVMAAEVKYQVIDEGSQLVPSLSLMYKF